MLNGYDLDGVLTAGIKPKMPFVVITGRENESAALDEWKAKAIVYQRTPEYPATSDGTGHFKAKTIKALGVTNFYENNTHEAAIIHAEVPSCHVHLVGDVEDSPWG